MLPIVRLAIAFWLLISLATVAAAEEASCPPSSSTVPQNNFVIKYDVETRGIVAGAAIWTVKPLDERRNLFRVELATKGVVNFFYPVGTKSETIWSYDEDCGVRPLYFEYTHSRRPKRNFSIDFDWPHSTARVHFRGKTRQEPLTEHTYDNQLFLLELGLMAENGKRQITLETIGNKNRRERSAVVSGAPLLNTDAGPVRTFQFDYEDDEKRTTVWYSQAHQLLPVMIEYLDKEGGLVRLTATSIRIAGQSAQSLEVGDLVKSTGSR